MNSTYYSSHANFSIPTLEEIESIRTKMTETINTRKEKIKKNKNMKVSLMKKNKMSKKIIESFEKSIDTLQKSLDKIEMEFLDKMMVLQRSQEIVQSPDLSKNLDVVPTISFMDDDFLDNLQYIFSDKKIFKDYDSSYKNTCHSEYKVRPHQKLVYEMASPNIQSNLLTYHDMGTGKTCAIVQCILSIALYYSRKKKLPDISSIPGVLLLNQDEKQKDLYIQEIVKGCYYHGMTKPTKENIPNSKNIIFRIQSEGNGTFFMEGDINGEYIKFQKDDYTKNPEHYPKENPNNLKVGETRNGHNDVMYTVTKRKNSNVWKKENSIFLFVKISKMTQKINPSPKIIDSVFDKNNAYLPKQGVVLIDEAHNFINPKNLNTIKNVENNINSAYFNYRKSIFKSKLKKIFFSGTPSNDFSMEGTKYIFNLINFLSPVKFSNSYYKTNDKEIIEKKDWFQFNDYFQENEMIRKDKKKEIADKIKSIVSYFTYRYDYSIYPELKVNIVIEKNKFQLSQGNHLSLRFDSITKSFQDIEEGTVGPPVVYVETEMMDMMTKTKFPFKKTKNNSFIPKHDAICKMVVMNPNRKHFFFMDVNTAPQSGVYQFATEIFPSLIDQYSFESTKKHKILIKLGLFWKIEMKSGGEDSFVRTVLEYLNYIRSTLGKNSIDCDFYCVLESNDRVLKIDREKRFLFPNSLDKKNKIISFQEFTRNIPDLDFSIVEQRRIMNQPLKMFKLLYNHILNRNGQIIRYVFGLNDSKEGLDLFTTSFVHFLKPPESISVFQQASARAARFCSFARYYPNQEIPHVYTPIVYYDVSQTQPREDQIQLQSKEKIQKNIKSPTEKILDLFQTHSIDCQLHANRTKTNCKKDKGLKFKDLGKLCISPYNAKIQRYEILAKFRTCYTRNLIPSSVKFTEWHYALYLLFQKNNVISKKLSNSLAKRTMDMVGQYYQKHQITLNGLVSSLQFIYYLYLQNKDKKDSLKYFQAIHYILTENFNALSKSEKEQLEKDENIKEIVNNIFDKGEKLIIIKNYKNISRETQENLDTLQIDKVLNDYNSSIRKSTRKIRKTNIQSRKILTTTSKTRSGKLYNRKEIQGSKTRSGKLFR